jgi:molecular chaperone GrpE
VKVLEGRGVKAFETVGKEFSVDYHDALMQMPRNDLPPHTVIEEVEKGYMLNDKVIRHAKVVVSAVSPDGPSEARQSESSTSLSKE